MKSTCINDHILSLVLSTHRSPAQNRILVESELESYFTHFIRGMKADTHGHSSSGFPGSPNRRNTKEALLLIGHNWTHKFSIIKLWAQNWIQLRLASTINRRTIPSRSSENKNIRQTLQHSIPSLKKHIKHSSEICPNWNTEVELSIMKLLHKFAKLKHQIF